MIDDTLSPAERYYDKRSNIRRSVMVSKEALCKKIHELYPQIGECDIDLNVNWDEDRNAWAVDF